MRGHAQKLIEYSPGHVPGIRSRAPAFEPIAARSMEWGFNISGIDQHIGIDRKQLAAFHGLVQGVAVGNIDEGAAAVECRQGYQFVPLAMRAKQQAERRFDQFRHGAALTCGLALELGHDGVVNVESSLHMAICINHMAIWQVLMIPS
jgi:hypothetical protein